MRCCNEYEESMGNEWGTDSEKQRRKIVLHQKCWCIKIAEKSKREERKETCFFICRNCCEVHFGLFTISKCTCIHIGGSLSISFLSFYSFLSSFACLFRFFLFCAVLFTAISNRYRSEYNYTYLLCMYKCIITRHLLLLYSWELCAQCKQRCID